MQNKLLSNSFFSVGINLMVKAIWILGVELAIQTTLGHEIYGKYFALYNFSIFFLLFTDFGINNYNTREISKSNLQLPPSIHHIFTLKIILGIVYLLIMLGSGLAFGFHLSEFRYLALIGAIQILASMSLFLRSNLSGLHMFKKDAIIGVSDKLMMILGCSFFLFYQKLTTFTLDLFLYVQLASYFIATGLGFVFLFKRIRFKLVAPKLKIYQTILKYGLPFSVLFFTMSVYMRMDGVLLKQLLPDGELQAGVYAAAFRLLDAFIQVTIIVSGIMLPILSKEIAEKTNISNTVSTSLTLLITPAIILAGLGIFASGQLADLLYKENISDIASVMMILLPSSVPYILSLIFGTVLTAGGRFRELNLISTLCMVLNLIFHYLMIPKYGFVGAAWVTGCTHTLSFLCLIVITTNYYQISLKRSYMLKTFLFLIMVGSSGYLLMNKWTTPILGIWIVGFGLISLIMGLIPIKPLLQKIGNKG